MQRAGFLHLASKWPTLFFKINTFSTCNLNASKMYRSTSILSPKVNDKGVTSWSEGKPFEEIPGPKGLPYFGTLFQYNRGQLNMKRYHKILLLWYREYGKIFKETIAGKTVVHIFELDDIKKIYQLEGKMPHVPPIMESSKLYRKAKGLSLGMGNSNGKEWYRLRSSIQEMLFRPKAVEAFLSDTDQVIKEFIDRVKLIRDSRTGEVPDLNNEVAKANLETSGMRALGKRFHSFQSNQPRLLQDIIDINDKIMDLSLKLKFSFPLHHIFSTPLWKSVVNSEDRALGHTQALADEALAKIKKLIQDGKLRDGDYKFLTTLMNKKNLKYGDFIVLIHSVLIDSLVTTNPTMTALLYCLATSPEKQEKLYQEVRRIAPNPREPITQDMLNQASYVQSCVKEGLRLYHPGTEISRVPDQNCVLSGYQIPAGTHIDMNQNILFRLPEYFEDPLSFIPERWEQYSNNKYHSCLFVPFGIGHRSCIGRRFAEQEMYVMLMRMVQNFRLEWPHQETLEQNYKILLRLSIPARIKFSPRL